MRIAALGAGAVGGYFGGRLAQAGHDVTFIARGAHLTAIRNAGLRVDSIAGDFVVAPAQATDDPAGVGFVDFVILAVKTWQLGDAARALRPLVGPHTAVLPLLNGVEAADELTAVLGVDHVLAGMCRIITTIEGPGHIRHSGAVPFVALGELDNTVSDRVRRLHGALVGAGVGAEIAADIHVAVWEKFMFIATMSGIGAVTRAPIGEWLNLPHTRRMAEAALQEVVAVGRAHGVALPDASVADTLAFMDGVPPSATASMQRDIMAGRPSELEAQSGAVVRLGAQVGVPTPVHSFLYHSLLPKERAARGQR
jgi:2-dehydropantoate 2-reductase